MSFEYNSFYTLDLETKQKLERIEELKQLVEYRSALANSAKPRLTLELGNLKEVNTFTFTVEYIEAINKAKEIKLKLIEERINWLMSEISNKGDTSEVAEKNTQKTDNV